MGLLKFDTWLTVAICSVLVLLYVTTLIKVCIGSKYQFVIKLLVLLIFSNIGLAFDQFGDYKFELFRRNLTGNDPIFCISIIFISGLIYNVCFNVSHWIFAFEYYSIARFMPYVFKGQGLPESNLKYDRRLNNTMFLLNIALPLLNKIAALKANLVEGNGHTVSLWLNIFNVVTMFFVLILRLVIGSFLGYAIYSIWKQLKHSDDKSADVDIRILVLHASAFGLYMISILANFIVLAYYYLNGEKNSKASIISDIF